MQCVQERGKREIIYFNSLWLLPPEKITPEEIARLHFNSLWLLHWQPCENKPQYSFNFNSLWLLLEIFFAIFSVKTLWFQFFMIASRLWPGAPHSARGAEISILYDCFNPDQADPAKFNGGGFQFFMIASRWGWSQPPGGLSRNFNSLWLLPTWASFFKYLRIVRFQFFMIASSRIL